MQRNNCEARERARELAEKYISENDPTGWFEELYREAKGDYEKVSWADLAPNRFLVRYAEQIDLQGNNRKALVVGCGLGDDARFLHDLNFDVTAFDVSPTAIEWARRLHKNTDIKFITADLFSAPKDWYQAFEFVLEVYTIQPLPLEMRPRVIDAIANFVEFTGKLIVVTCGRDDDEKPVELPWALSREDLSRFETNGLKQIRFEEMLDDEDDEPIPRFVIEYERI